MQETPSIEYGRLVVNRIIASAATMLTSMFGNNYSFIDSAETPFGRPAKHFGSFNEAAQEASMSRLLRGIHFPYTRIRSAAKGIQIGEYIARKLDPKNQKESPSLILNR